jgi:hypothetical protein
LELQLTHGVELIARFAIIAVPYGLLFALVACVLAKIRKRAIWLYVQRAIWVAVGLACLGLLPYLPGSPGLDVRQAFSANRALEETIWSFCAIVLDYQDGDISYDEYLRLAECSLEACVSGADSQCQAMDRYSEGLPRDSNDVVEIVTESFALKAAQVLCLEKMHEAIIELETGDAEVGDAQLAEYQAAFVRLQEEYDSNMAKLSARFE